MKLEKSVDFVVKNISNDLGIGYKAVDGKVVKIQDKLTDVKVVLQPDNRGGYFVLTIYPKLSN